MDDNLKSDKSDSEVIDVTPAEEKVEQTPDDVKTQLSVENLIRSFMKQIERIKEDLKPQKEMLDDLLNNNEEYRIAADAAKEASKKKSAVKKKVLSTPEGQMANDKVSTLKDELKEAQEGLSSYLADYQRLTGSSQFEGEDGELRQIVYVAKLVRKTNLER